MGYEMNNELSSVPKQIKMCSKGFHVDSNLLMYASHLNKSQPVLIVPRSCSTQILELFYDHSEAGYCLLYTSGKHLIMKRLQNLKHELKLSFDNRSFI